jgi:hypothetical protein
MPLAEGRAASMKRILCLRAILTATGRELRIPHPTSTEGSGFVTVSVRTASIVTGLHDMFLCLMQVADEALHDAKRAANDRLIAKALDPQ